MPPTNDQFTALSLRLHLAERLAATLNQTIEPLLTAGVIEAAGAAELATVREIIADATDAIRATIARGTATPTHQPLDRNDASTTYLQAQQLAALLAQAARKTTVLLAPNIEGAAAPAAMRTAWSAALDAHLAAIAAALAAMPTNTATKP